VSHTQKPVTLLPRRFWLGFTLVSLACAPAPQPAADLSSAHRERENPLVVSLLLVADKSIEAGDLAAARNRYERILDLQPGHVEAWLGLARIERLRGNEDAERQVLERVLERSPRSSAALRRLSRLERLAGDDSAALALVERALEQDPNQPELLALQMEITGPAPPLTGRSDAEIIALSLAHPFDLSARLAASRTHLARGETEDAGRLLRRSYWLADLDPTTGGEIAALLASFDSRFAKRKIVPVHVYADQTITARPGWAMRLRILLRKLSASLDPMLATHFVAYSISPFSTAGAADDLTGLENAWLESRSEWPEEGILLAFTQRARGKYEPHAIGRAELLGRRAIVRLEPGADESRTLIHEVFHLYGGVHVADVLDSLMNPSGETAVIDPLNARIVRLTRGRAFGPGGEASNIDPFVDMPALIDVYVEALRVNLILRQEGLGRAQKMNPLSRDTSRALIESALRLDTHLAQVSEQVSRMLVRDKLYARAADYCDLAARLFGETTAAGRTLYLRGQRLRTMSARLHSGFTPDPPVPAPR